MPQGIAKKLKEMKEPNYREARRTRLDQIFKRFHSEKKHPNGPIDVEIKFASLESETQKKLLSLMQNIFEIGKAASKIYEENQYALIKIYFCAILDPTDLIQTLSSFQTVLYSPDELPVFDNLFWPGGGTTLCETRFTLTGTTIYCLHPDMDTISDAWQELSICVQSFLSMWADESVDVEKDDAETLPDYWPGQAAYRKEKNALISKVDHLIRSMPQIASHMNAFAEAQRDLNIQHEIYEDNNYWE